MRWETLVMAHTRAPDYWASESLKQLKQNAMTTEEKIREILKRAEDVFVFAAVHGYKYEGGDLTPAIVALVESERKAGYEDGYQEAENNVISDAYSKGEEDGARAVAGEGEKGKLPLMVDRGLWTWLSKNGMGLSPDAVAEELLYAAVAEVSKRQEKEAN